MEAKYFPIQIEEKWSKIWADKELARPDLEDYFSQIIPPPNVTGTLHMGHSFQYAIMDFYTRYHHMNQKKLVLASGNRPRWHCNPDGR